MHPVFQTQLFQIFISYEINTIHFMQVSLHDLSLLELMTKCLGMRIFSIDHRLDHKSMFSVQGCEHISQCKMPFFYPIRTGDGVECFILIFIS